MNVHLNVHRTRVVTVLRCIRLLRYGLLAVCLLLVSSCSLLFPEKTSPPCKYRLTCTPSSVPTKARRHISLLVITPAARPVYDSTKMTYTIRPYQIAYFSRNEWAETPGQMLRPLIVRTLERAGHFKLIVVPPYSGQTDYVLNTEIIEFNQNFLRCGPCFVLVLRAQLLKTSVNKIIATKQFIISLPMVYGTPYAGVFAANHAVSMMLRELAAFCLENT